MSAGFLKFLLADVIRIPFAFISRLHRRKIKKKIPCRPFVMHIFSAGLVVFFKFSSQYLNLITDFPVEVMCIMKYQQGNTFNCFNECTTTNPGNKFNFNFFNSPISISHV